MPRGVSFYVHKSRCPLDICHGSSLKRVVAFLCFLAVCSTAKAESVFSLNLKTDIVLGTLALGVLACSFLIDTTPGHIPAAVHRSDLNALDRSLLVTRRIPTIRYISSATMFCMSFLPLLSMRDNFNMTTLTTYGIMYAQAAVLAFGTRRLMKENVTRFRPWYYDGRELGANPRHDSFPSGHTCAAFLSATFFSTTFALENPDSRWKWPAIVGSHALAAGVGAMRVLSGMHFFTDILAGAAIGSFYGWLIPVLHVQRNRNNVNYFPIKLIENGLSVSLRL